MEEKIRLAVFGQKRLSREGGIEIVVKELCTRMAQNGCDITCYNRAGHHVSGAEYDKTIEYDGIRQKVVPTIEKKGLAVVSSSFFAALCSAFGRYDVVHIHAEGPAFFAWLPKMFGKRVVVTVHGPASFIMPLQIGKTPIVVPRQHQFNEHVNDHQVEFARNVAQRMGTIIPVEDINTLGDIITNYDQIVAGMGHGMSSNNAKFNEELEKIVEKMMEEKK